MRRAHLSSDLEAAVADEGQHALSVAPGHLVAQQRAHRPADAAVLHLPVRRQSVSSMRMYSGPVKGAALHLELKPAQRRLLSRAPDQQQHLQPALETHGQMTAAAHTLQTVYGCWLQAMMQCIAMLSQP